MTGAPPRPELRVLDRIPSGSNAVLRCVDTDGERWIYKPVAGERPLADFPDGTLAHREVAAYVTARLLGWDLVPETVLVDGPAGPGMAQRWIDVDPDAQPVVGIHLDGAVPRDHISVVRGEDRHGRVAVVAHALDTQVRRIAVFDEVINNADRKGGHLLRSGRSGVWAIDHGLAFHVEPKVRTVLWGWAGQPLAQEDHAALRELAALLEGDDPLVVWLRELLAAAEVAALQLRVAELSAAGAHPVPGAGYPLPWPLL